MLGARHDRGNDLACRRNLGDPRIGALDVVEERSPEPHGAQQVGQDVAAHRYLPQRIAIGVDSRPRAPIPDGRSILTDARQGSTTPVRGIFLPWELAHAQDNGGTP